MAWGRFGVSSTSGGLAPVENSRVGSGYVGLESRLNGQLAGLAVSRSDASLKVSNIDRELELDVTSVTPYLHRQVDKDMTLWGLISLGTGSLRVSKPQDEAAMADLRYGMAAVGIRRSVLDFEKIAISTKADGMVSVLRNDRATRLPAVTASARQARLAAEGTRSWTLTDGWGDIALTANLGLRLDGGDSDNGVGTEIGSRLEYSLPTGLSGWLRGHYLLAHESADLKEQGVSAGLRQEADKDGEGLWFEWLSAWGVDGRQQHRQLRDQGVGTLPGDLAAGGEMELKVGYGVRYPTPVPLLLVPWTPSQPGRAFAKAGGLWTPFGEWSRAAPEGESADRSFRYGVRLDVELMPDGSSTESVSQRQRSASLSLEMSNGIKQQGKEGRLLLNLAYEF